MMIDRIKQKAAALGACGKEKNVNTYQGLVNILFSPQGREFCTKHNFPSLEVFREIKSEVKRFGVFIDAGTINICRKRRVCLAGNTSAQIEASGVDFVHTIVLMHGASAIINASNYAVLRVENISGGEVKINKDKTVVVL